MKSNFNYIVIGIICLISNVGLRAQDFHFSQFYNSPLTVNPGNTGVFNGDLRVYTMYRMQWFTVTKPYKTFSLGADAPIFRKRMPNDDFFSVGLNVNNDGQGIINYMTNSFNGLFSFTKYLGGRQNHDITIGYEVGYSMVTANLKDLTWDSQYDPATASYQPGLGFNESYGGGGAGYIDMSTGLVWNFTSSNLFRSALGFSVHHFTSPNVSINSGVDKLLPKFGVQWNMAYRLNDRSNTTILPSLMAAQQGASLLINGGANVKFILEESSRYTNYQNYKAIYFGAFYRFRDAAYLTFRVDYGNFSFGMAYDVNISKLTPASKTVGGFEFLLQYRGAFGKHKIAKRNSMRFL
jgi:type IX secretion system PorP/SprF family membrane protein